MVGISELGKLQKRLSEFVEQFEGCLGRVERRHWCKVYLSGLLLDGERKSIQPMAERLGCDWQALQQFVKDSPWGAREVQKALFRLMSRKLLNEGAADWILDDTGLPKKGKASVGVARQYCGATGKIDNCQSVVSWHCSGQGRHFPALAQLYLPEAWSTDKARMEKAGVPEASQVFKEKWRIALELLDEMDQAPMDTLLFDAGYGANRVFLKELDQRKKRFIGQIRGIETFWSADVPLDTASTHPTGQGRRRKHLQVLDPRLKPQSAQQWASLLFASNEQVRTCDLNLQQPKKAEYVAIRVYETVARPFRRVGPERWLIIERLVDGSFKYYVSNHTVEQEPETLLVKAHKRWEIEQGYQQLKEELGLDHYEGRSWQGLHHHLTLCFMAYGFLQLLKLDQKKETFG